MGPMFGQKNVFIYALNQRPKEHVFFGGHVRAMLGEHCVLLKRALLRPQFLGAPSFLVLLS
jgi:hypothetical protein